MSLQGGEQFARDGIPKLRFWSAEPEARVFRPDSRQRCKQHRCVLQVGQQFTRGGIPNSNRSVTRTRGEGFSIRTPGYAVDILSVSLQAGQQFARGAIQSFTVLSVQPETRNFPSGLQAMLRTSPVCPCMLTSILPRATSQSMSVVSPELDARVFPIRTPRYAADRVSMPW